MTSTASTVDAARYAPEMATLLQFTGETAGAIRMCSRYNPEARHGVLHGEVRETTRHPSDLMYLADALTQMLEVGVAVERGDPRQVADVCRHLVRTFSGEYMTAGGDGANTFAFWKDLVDLRAAVTALAAMADKAEATKIGA